jgi:1,4-alpha-glucan branching enzyme
VNFIQNHDQIGNRPLGERLLTQASQASLESALAILLLAPMPPLLFMGEECGASTPFPFFCDFPEPLASAVRQGRRNEFREAYAHYGDRIPDPLAKATFQSAVLDWDSRASPAGSRRLELVRELLAIRQREITPHLSTARFGAAQHRDGQLQAYWSLAERRSVVLVANLSNAALPMIPSCAFARRIWGAEETRELAPWAVRWSIGTH